MVAGPRPTEVTVNVSRGVDFNSRRTSLAIANLGVNRIYYGMDSELTADNGFPIPAGAILVFSKAYGDNPTLTRYFIADAGVNDVRVSEEFKEVEHVASDN